MDVEGNTVTRDEEKAEVLTAAFVSVFCSKTSSHGSLQLHLGHNNPMQRYGLGAVAGKLPVGK